MATRKKAESEKEQPKEAAVESAPPPQTAPKKTAPKMKIGKLVKKNKARLPRKEKKAAKKKLAQQAR
jgi:hypothetical protein